MDLTNWRGVALLKAQMNADLLADDLKKKRTSDENFWLIGQPDVGMERIPDGEGEGIFRVSVRGFNYSNTKAGNVESGGADRIALWIIDLYDERGLFPGQAFFPTVSAKDGWATLAQSPKAETNATRMAAYRGTFSPLRTPRAWTRGAQDRGRPGCREPQDRGSGVMQASVQPGTNTVEDREGLASRIDLPMNAIEALRDRWQVEELALFGSVLRDDCGPESDIDILIRFETERTPGLFGIAAMEREPGDLFGRRVDLVTRAAIETGRNYIRRKAILESAQVVYAA